MKLTCTQKNLNKAINIVGRIINKNTTLPILNNVLLKTDKGRLKISSTNLELGISYWIGSKIEKEGEITIPTKLFSNFVSNLPDSNIEMKLRDDVLNIKCNGYKTNIKGLSAKEYPLTPKINNKPLFQIKSFEFKQALLQTLPSISVSESRIEITGVLMDLSELNKNKITMVSTDSYRLAEKTIELEKDSVDKEALDSLGNIKSVIIPKNTIQELARNLDDEEEIIKTTISENQILFTFGNASLISRIIEGKYPDYKQIIPNKFGSEIKVGIKEITNAIKVASLFASPSSNSIELKLAEDSKNLEISAEAADLGNNNTKIPVEISGKSFNVTYNHRYLVDGFNSLEGEKALLKINDANSPSVLSSVSNDDFLYIIMPVRA